MKITLIVVGKTDGEWLQKGVDQYVRRIGFYLPFEWKTIPDVKNSKGLSIPELKEKEAEMVLPFLGDKYETYLLDENGTEYSSRELARFLERKMVGGSREISFIIGGAYGFSPKIHEKATGKISLSRMTFSHQLVRLLFVEQLYRAFTIIRGEPYHHD